MSSSDEDDMPLARRPRKSNGRAVLPDKIDPAVDRKYEEESMEIDSAHAPGIAMDPAKVSKVINGTSSKRKAAMKPTIKDEESDSDDEPLSKRRRTVNGINRHQLSDEEDDSDAIPLKSSRGKKPVKPKEESESDFEESDDDDIPLQKLAKEKKDIEKAASQQAKKERATPKTKAAATKKTPQKKATPKTSAAAKRKPKDETPSDASDSDVPIAKQRKTASAKKGKAVKKEEEEEPTPAKAKKGKAKVKVEEPAPKKATKGKGKAKEEEAATPEGEEESDEYKWWLAEQSDGKQKWETLQHAGVMFPPPYEPLPSNVKMRYNGVPINLNPEAEEVAGFMAALLEADQAKDQKFIENFFADWKKVLKESGGAKDQNGKTVKIESYDKCDFRPMFEYFTAQKEAKKAMSAAEKKAAKAEREKIEEPYQYCQWNGRKEKVGNFRVEPPGLFRGRGEHPKRGMLKKRVAPEQITLNIGKEATVPPPPKGHKWGNIVHNQTASWLAMWTENINNNVKYVMLAVTSSLKGQSDFKKYEKARELKKHIDKIRRDYTRDLSDKQTMIRQRATAIYLIDKFALRAGNEKGDDEADTVGCCSLRYEHVTLEEPNLVHFKFLGKDSIQFDQVYTVDKQVFKNLRIFKKAPKGPGDDLFDRIQTKNINDWFKEHMEGLSAKVFRTYNASWTMQKELAQMKNTGTVADKCAAYNEANKKVAILCNHQRTKSKMHDTQMEKKMYEIKALMYQKWRLKKMILDLEPKLAKKKPEYFKPDAEIDNEEWIKEHQEWLIEEEKKKIEKKFAKENEKLVENGEKEMKASELKSRLSVLHDMEKEFKAENKTGKIPAAGKSPSVEKFEEQIKKIEDKIQNRISMMKDKENTSEVSLGTSKINYIDPRLSVVFCKRFGVPLEKIFAKALRDKFKWAIESVDENWEF
ncbi:DNA topoisomerase 1 [Orbilia brochopaga]|uniref:DNA topoisomerase I n=1 Tax=Orbilia brochopaga TaxID=3140254 RepID=A0AAV9U0N3_9PEZI